MNAWNPEIVTTLSSKQLPGFVTNINGRVRLQPALVAKHFRQLTADSSTTSDRDKLTKAIDLAKTELSSSKPPPFPYTKPCFGYVAQWLSELGQTELLDGLLTYADQELNPTWENGGLYYPRNDTPFIFSDRDDDIEGVKWTHISPFCGNAAIAYSRLNIKDGQRKMYEKPWTREHLSRTPYIDNLEFASKHHGVSVLRGVWDENEQALILTVRGWDFEGRECPEKVSVEPAARQLAAGVWAVYVQGKLVEERKLKGEGKEGFGVKFEVGRGGEVDVVFLRVRGDGVVNGTGNGT